MLIPTRDILEKVLNAVQTGPYSNIYNPENFFIGKQGLGAGNNWAAGYAAGEHISEEVFDMIDREADGSDSLEVCSPICLPNSCSSSS